MSNPSSVAGPPLPPRGAQPTAESFPSVATSSVPAPPPPHESWRTNACAAFIAGFINDSAFYAIDSYKLLLQATAASSSVSLPSATTATVAATTVAAATAAAARPIPTSSLSRAYASIMSMKARAAPLFRGAVPVIATGSGPVMGLFFAIYAYTKPTFAEFFRTSPYSPYWTQHNTVPAPAAPPSAAELAAAAAGASKDPVAVVSAITAATQEARIEMASAAAASLLAGVPASLLGVPSDVIKKYIILTPPTAPIPPAATNLAAAATAASAAAAAGVSPSRAVAAAAAAATLPRSPATRPRSPAVTAIRAIIRDHGWGGFFTGWQANLFKDLPMSMFKMAFFEGAAMTLTSSRNLSWYPRWLWTPDAASETALEGKGSDASSAAAAAAAEDLGHGRPGLTSAESAVAGLVSGALTVIVTMPLDVINTRMKAPNATDKIAWSMIAAGKDVVKRGGGIGALWHGTMPRMISFGLGAAVFWTCFAELQKQVRALGVE